MTIYTCIRGDLTQRLAVVDLDSDDGVARAIGLLPDQVSVNYSDPPWNPGNATYWRTHADQDPCTSYARFLDRVVAIASACQERGASNVLIEQSIIERDLALFKAAVERSPSWLLPFEQIYRIQYSRPLRPNALMHWGEAKLRTDPTDMDGEPMTTRVFAGLGLHPGEWVVDQCMGKGTTSRVAHAFGLNCVGTELNHKRLAKTVEWLARRGYSIEAR